MCAFVKNTARLVAAAILCCVPALAEVPYTKEPIRRFEVGCWRTKTHKADEDTPKNPPLPADEARRMGLDRQWPQ